MAHPNYVCTICSQTFTRKWRGSVHSNNLHAGLAKVVRLIDYMIGRSNGEYVSSDPSLYRRGRRLGDSIEHKRSLLDKKLGQVDYFHLLSLSTTPARNQQQYFSSDSKPVQDRLQQLREGIIKKAELKKLLSTHLPPGEVYDTLSFVYDCCVARGNNRLLDQVLEEATINAKLKEALDYLKTP